MNIRIHVVYERACGKTATMKAVLAAMDEAMNILDGTWRDADLPQLTAGDVIGEHSQDCAGDQKLA